jgi:hypothetical protein
MPYFGESLPDDANSDIYIHNMFMKQATELAFLQ